MKPTGNTPSIVIGMHRSGTSLLSKLLRDMGVFMGADWEENNESRFFLQINDWLLEQAGVSVHDPVSFQYITDDFKALMSEIIRIRFRTFHRKKYLGNHTGYKSLEDIDIPWGWKDPRNTFTYDVWKEIFPDAKVIHLYRNPVDVARSLVERESSAVNRFAGSIETRTGLKKKYLGYALPGKRLFFQAFKSTSLDGAYAMWQEYVTKAMSINAQRPDRILHVCYEELLADPEEAIRKIASFLGLQIGQPAIGRLAGTVNPQRRCAFIGNKTYEEFYHRIKNDPMVIRMGYDNLV